MRPDKQAAEMAQRVSNGASFLDAATARREGKALPHAGPSASHDISANRSAKPVPHRVTTHVLNPPTDWPELQPLTTDVEPVAYPLDALPTIIREAVEQVSHEVQAPEAMIACSALSAVSVVGQGLIDVLRAPHLRSSVNLFLLVIADSGERKSASDKRLTDALFQFEREALAKAKPSLERYRADKLAWEAKRDGVLLQIRQAARKNNVTDYLEVRLRELEAVQPAPPRVPRLVYADVTPEGLTYGLAKHWPSASILSNEAGIFFGSHGMSGESVMRNVAQLNTLWDGGKISIDRRSTDSYVVDGARLTMSLMVQEPMLRSFFDRNMSQARGSGFLARFLVASPDSKMGTRLYRDPDPYATGVSNFNRRLAELLALPLPFDDNGYLCPRPVSLSEAARQHWIAYYNLTESQLGIGGELDDVRDIVSKSAENAARIAGLLHLISDKAGDIDEDTMDRACRIAAWHLNESRRFFAKIELPQDVSDAVRLVRWLQHWCQKMQITAENRSVIQNRTHGDLREKHRFRQAINLLTERGYIRQVSIKRQTLLELNPELILPPKAR